MRPVVVGLVLAALAGGAAAEPLLIDLGRLPPDAVSFARTGLGGPGAWAVRPDASAASGSTLIQTSTDTTDYRFPLAILEKASLRNGTVTVRFNAIAGGVDRAGGLAIRLADKDTYYVVRANALEDNVNFYRVSNGSRREIRGASAKVATGVWHTLGIKANGPAFTVSFDGAVLFTARDSAIAGAGKVGLWTKADSVTAFERLTIEAAE